VLTNVNSLKARWYTRNDFIVIIASIVFYVTESSPGSEFLFETLSVTSSVLGENTH
jgi:hypothetical protein